MTKPIELRDGHAFVGGLVAVLDETAPEVGAGVYYVVTSAVMFDPLGVALALNEFFADVTGRLNPFHWKDEGPKARSKMVDLILAHDIVAVSKYQSVGRGNQVKAREQLLPAMAEELGGEMQIDHLIIERGDRHTNRRDEASLLDHYRGRGGVPFAYDWRSKSERVLWIADAISGVVHDYFAHDDRANLDRLLRAGVLLNEPEYVA